MTGKILFTAQFNKPSEDIGGSNNIINKIISRLENDVDYISNDYYIKFYNNKNYQNEIIRLNEFPLKIHRKMVHILNDNQTLGGLYLKWFLSLNYWGNKIRKVVESNSYKLIHAHHQFSLTYFKNINLPKILTIHSKGSIVNDIGMKLNKHHKEIIKDIERESVKYADTITFPSIAAKEMYIKDIGEQYFEKKNISVIYNGIDKKKIENIKEVSKTEISKMLNVSIGNDKLLLNIADHVKLKNIDKLILSIREVINDYGKKIKVINIGSGSETDNLKKLIKLHKLEDIFFLVGRKNNEELLKILKSADLLVMPSDKVVYDLVNLESLACGTPLLLSKNGGNLEILKEGRNGFFIEENTPKYISKGIIKALSADLKNNLEEYNFNDVSDMVNNYNSIYEQYSD